jgi:hypothetical protein
MHSGAEVGLFGDFSNEGTFTNNLGTLRAVGSIPQTFNGTNAIHTNNFTINKGSSSLQLDNVLEIDNVLTFTNGLIITDHADIATEFVEFQDNATYSTASNASHIDGVIRKIGNDDFIFPTGDNNILRTISVSAPSDITDHFTAYYTENNPDGFYSRSLLDINIDHVSSCEYWVLNRTGGSSNVEVSLSWDSNSCGVDNLCDLLVSRWDGTQWTSEGNGGATGSTAAGTLVSGNSCTTPVSVTNFSPFTLGSISSNNPLPIGLISFEANICEKSVCLTWQTESEVNNDFFTIEKSDDGKSWEVLEEVKGAGNSQIMLNYETIDRQPFSGLSYYRLKQTDFDGTFKYASIESVYLDDLNNKDFIIYPNPARDLITIKGLSPEEKNIELYNSIGQSVKANVKIMEDSKSNLRLDVSTLDPGVYYVKTINNYMSFVKQ